jgi:hypothetical protein
MPDYTIQLESAKSAALTALTDLLTTTKDPIEKRRIATAILRLPTPKPTTDRATGCPGFDGQPVRDTQDRATECSDTGLDKQPVRSTPSAAPAQPTQSTNPTPNALPPIAVLAAQYSALSPRGRLQAHNEANTLLNNLSISPKPRPHTPAALIATAGTAQGISGLPP